MSVSDVADRLGVSRSTVYNLINRGQLRARWRLPHGYIILPSDVRNYETRQSCWPSVRTPLIDALVSN